MKKLMKTMKFAPNLDQKVDMEKVNLDTVKPWVVNRITSLLGFEDDVVTEFIFNLLENEKVRNVRLSICMHVKLFAWCVCVCMACTPSCLPVV